MRYRHSTIVVVWLASWLAGGADNLLPNGSFEAGEGWAEDWERPNGLTSFLVAEAGRGRVVKLDTWVERQQALAWMKAFAEDPEQPPPVKLPVSKDSYGTIGGFEGVSLDSVLIEVKPGQNYKLSADLKGEGAAIVWIKGFQKHPRRDAWADGYQTRLVPGQVSASQWGTFAIGFNPTARTPKIERMKVRLYAYWPNGLYYFDNIRIEEISPEEMAELEAARHLK